MDREGADEAGDRRPYLDAYLERIGYSGDRSPTLATLGEIHVRHTEAIPFENLNPLLKLPVSLDLPSLTRKLVHDGRGGYCFEQNLLLWHMLESLGYSVSGLAARVIWKLPEGSQPARGHILLRVTLDRVAYIVDVAYGRVTLTVPLRLEASSVQSTTHEPFRLLESDGEFTVQALLRDEWRSLYRFGAETYFPDDYTALNWYASTHPQSRFVNNLVAARTTADRRYTLINNEFGVHISDGVSERRIILDPNELKAILTEQIGIRLPQSSEMDVLLRRLTHQP